MKFAKNTIFLLLLAVAASLTAAAQDKTAVFTLKQDAYWGAASLPAGQYRMTLVSGPVTKAIVASTDSNGVAVIAVPVARDYNQACNDTALTLTPSGGTYAVTAVCFADSKMAYFFPDRVAQREHVAQAQAFAGSK